MSGAMEARELLHQLTARKDHLQDLTKGGISGIINAGRITRLWVDDSQHGYPFLSSTDILQADLSNISHIAKSVAHQNSQLLIRDRWTLITRSGSIGRMAYARADMDGMACTEDVLRVIPDENKVKSGYIYAYLGTRFGLPIVTSGTYGSIITHLEPHHIAHLPVPRLGEVEDSAHELVQAAADLRSEASKVIEASTSGLLKELNLPALEYSDVSQLGWSSVSSANLKRRLDAPYHSPAALEAEAAIKNGRYSCERLSTVAERLFKPPIFKRLWVDDETYGRQFISGTDAYLYEANEPRFVSSRTPNFEEFIVKRGWVIFQAAGQIYGLFGRPLFVSGWLEDIFCADDLYRIVPKTEVDGAFIYLFLRTPHGQVLIKRQASGNSIPRVWDPHMAEFELPWPDESVRRQLAGPVVGAHDQIAEALELERQAVQLVERAIENGAR
ncbi:MAG: hypothetical protein CMH13_17460 [Martelella sp.]|nr:hypothetical protein [Martelella sp.]